MAEVRHLRVVASILARRGLLVLGLLALLLPTPARAASYGDIEVQPVRLPTGRPSHGYSEYVFEVRNRGSRPRRVELTLPGNLFGGPRQAGLRAIRRAATVGAGETALVTLLQPNTPEVPGDGVSVSIDGRKQDDPLAVSPMRGRSGYVSGNPGRRGRYMASTRPSMIGGMEGPLLLVSKAVRPEAFPDDNLRHLSPGRGQVQLVRTGLPLTTWSGDWLAYSRYDGIAVAPEDLRPGGGADAVVQALWQYAEAGGTLIVLGPGDFPMPGRRVRDMSVAELPPAPAVGGMAAGGIEIDIEEQPQPAPRPRVVPTSIERYPVGFGLCLVNKAPSLGRWEPGVGDYLGEQMSNTAQPWQTAVSLVHVNGLFPVVEDFGAPVRGLFGLIVVFGILIGPVNLALLAKSNRRIWMLWTVPAISLTFGLLVLGYMVAAEGWSGHARIAGVTHLDETTLRATTIGRAGFYSPLTPGGGLVFDDTTEVSPQGQEHSAFGNLCDLNWGDGKQHLARGWMSARVPAHFAVRKSEAQRRERVTVSREGGVLTMVNGLGVNIEKIVLADEAGVVYRAGPVGPGAKATLQKTEYAAVPERAVVHLRRCYTAPDWMNYAKVMPGQAHEMLTRRSYFAVVEGTPFLERPLKGAREEESKSYVFGLMAR